jgi:hypothetical protein
VKGAADLMLEAWYWMPAGLVLDLLIFHAVVRWLNGRPEKTKVDT